MDAGQGPEQGNVQLGFGDRDFVKETFVRSPSRADQTQDLRDVRSGGRAEAEVLPGAVMLGAALAPFVRHGPGHTGGHDRRNRCRLQQQTQRVLDHLLEGPHPVRAQRPIGDPVIDRSVHVITVATASSPSLFTIGRFRPAATARIAD